MKVCLVLTFLYLGSFINTCVANESSPIPQVEKAIELITETTNALTSSQFAEFFEKATEVAKKFSGFLQELNQFVKIGIEIVNTIRGVADEDPLDALKSYIGEQFAIVNGKLELIETKLDQVNLVFQDELAKSKLREFLHKRDNIREMLESFSKNPNNITTSQLKKVCDDNSMRGFINFLYTQVMDGGEGSLLAAMKRGNVRKTFFQWTKNIYGMFVEANVLYSHCFTAKYFNDYDENEFNHTMKLDSDKFQGMLDKITKKLESEHSEFLRVDKYMGWAKEDLKEMMKRHRGMEHQKFADLVTKHLTDKYDWREWIVGSYDGDTITSEQHQHTVTNNTILIFREENRCVFVVSLKQFNETSAEKKHIELFAKQIWWFLFRQGPFKTNSREKCKNIYNILKNQVGDLHIDCVKSEKGIKTSHSPGALYTAITVTTYQFSGKTRVFTNQKECNEWIHYNLRGHYHGMIFIPQVCTSHTMHIVMTKLWFM